jgi:hypothetical protein
MVQQKQEHMRETTMEIPPDRVPADTPTVHAMSSETVKLIRKLRWLGLEEKAEQLEDELEQQAATDTVVSIQSETD